jgi:hypothetical protein
MAGKFRRKRIFQFTARQALTFYVFLRTTVLICFLTIWIITAQMNASPLMNFFRLSARMAFLSCSGLMKIDHTEISIFVKRASARKDAKITIWLPDATDPKVEFTAEWINPATGSVLKHIDVSRGRHTLEAPSFTIDLALLAVPKIHW